jgi:hypothetical protein
MNATCKKRFYCFKCFTLVWSVEQFEGASQAPKFSMMIDGEVRAIDSGTFSSLLKGRKLSPARASVTFVVLAKRDYATETRRSVFEDSFRDVVEE